MKGLNVKKIAALAAGALFLGSAAVTAGLTYHDTELISDSGVPQVSVVVGENAAASDGVAAARIASFLASKAYKTTHYTADVTGEGQCTSTGGEEGGTTTGQCTDMSVTLKITSPGITGVTTFRTLINDYIDKELGNRYKDNRDCTSDDDSDVSPFTLGSGTCDPNEKDLYMITGDDFAPFASSEVTDPESGDTYTEEQYAWISGETKYDDGEIIADIDGFGYSVKFADPYTGIPVCTDDVDGDDDWADCGATSDYRSDDHRMQINFLGETWVITEMSPPTGTATDEDTLVEGGEVKLAKEAAYAYLNVGDSMTVGNYNIVLDDISTQTGTANQHPAILSIYDKDTGELLKQKQINPSSTAKVSLPNGDTLTIHVYQTAPGYTLSAKWAEIAIYAKEITLNADSDKIQDTADDSANADYDPYIYWKNKDASSSSATVDSLRSIVVYNDESNKMEKGDEYHILFSDDLDAFKMTYEGLEDVAMDDLEFQIYEGDDGLDGLKLCTNAVGGSAYGDVSDTLSLDSDEWGDEALNYIRITTSTSKLKKSGVSGDEAIIVLPGGSSHSAYVEFVGSSATVSNVGTAGGGDAGGLASGNEDIAFADTGGDVCNDISSALAAGNEVYIWYDADNNGQISSDEKYEIQNAAADGGQCEIQLTTDPSYTGPSPYIIRPAAGDVFIHKSTSSGTSCWEYVGNVVGSTLEIEYPGAGSYTSGAPADYSVGPGGYGYIYLDGNAADPFSLGYGALTDTGGDLGIYLAEDAGKWTDGTNTYDHAPVYTEFTATYAGTDDWDFISSGTTDDKVNYLGTGETSTSEKDEDYITERGTEYGTFDSEKREFSVATSVRHAVFTYTNADEEAEPNTVTTTLHEGDEYTVPGTQTKIEVVSIDGTANCGVSGTGATTCEYAGGITGVIKDEEGNTQTELTAIVPSDFSVSSLIKLDKDAMNDASFISVGGPKVNKVTARELTGANAVDFNTERVVVKQIAPGKIIVAGLTADDTLQAADQFINELKTLQ